MILGIDIGGPAVKFGEVDDKFSKPLDCFARSRSFALFMQ